MTSPLKVSCIQLTSTNDWWHNLEQVMSMMGEALIDQPRLIVLPENVFLFDAKQMRSVAEGDATSIILKTVGEFARQHGVYVLIGSHPMAVMPDGNNVVGQRVRQSSLLINDEGQLSIRYDKIHLFDVMVDDKAAVYQESKFIEPAEVVVTTAVIDGVTLGLSICYDLRFPELYRALQQADVDLVVVPSAFTHKTGEVHWHALLQARSIENQFYVAGVNQVGWHNEKRRTFGNTVAYSPWGERLSCLNDEESGWISFAVDTQYLEKIRAAMPCGKHRRLF